ncbi:MAG: hypothetical protein P4L65_10750 [Legionella sp.]|nr:hypothetical protein [Legionella sp.]
MKGINLINKIGVGVLAMLTVVLAYAGTPLWTFAPLSATTITVPTNDTRTVRYQVTNQSKRSHILMMQSIPGITQVTTAGNCSNPIVLGSLQPCILNLTIDGSALTGNVTGGPIVCQGGSPNQCYQPSSANSLNITKGPVSDYTVGGSIFGLQGTLVLENNGGEALTLNANGPFTFSNALPPGGVYSVTVQSQPADQTCTVSNGSGTITNAKVTNIIVTCATNSGGVTFLPLTPTTIIVSAHDTATVQYQVSNQLIGPLTLAMQSIPGITQVTTAGNCPNPFVLGHQQSCTLNLTINGSALTGDVVGGPVVCQGGTPNQCYQPDSANSLNITKA